MSSEIKELSDRAGTLACKTEIAATETMIEERSRPRSGRRNHLRLASMRIRWTNAANGAKTPKHNSSTRRSPPGSDYCRIMTFIRISGPWDGWSAATCHLARLATDLDTEHGGTDAN